MDMEWGLRMAVDLGTKNRKAGHFIKELHGPEISV